jgi:hypothetical protein
MDEDRRIRFLVPPMLFVASLLWGAWSNQNGREWIYAVLSKADQSPSIGQIVGVVAGAGVVVFAVGYIIGTCNYFFLRLAFRILRGRFHEVLLSDAAFARVWSLLGAPGVPNRAQELSAGAAFDYDILFKTHEGVHRWLFRRWNAFSIATSSIWALILSFPFGLVIQIPATCGWFLPVIVFMTILIFVARWAWSDAMGMLTFQAELPAPDAPKDGGNN